MNVQYQIFTEVEFEDRTVVPAKDQDITCVVSDLSQDTPVTWIGPDDEEILDSDTENYGINQGEYVIGTKTATLTIKTAKLSILSSGAVFKCKLRSAKYPDDSPDIVKEMTLSFYTFGMILKIQH